MLTTFRLYLLDEKLYEDDKNDKRQRICKVDLSKLKNWSEFLYKASVAADLEVVARRVFDAEGFEVTNLSQLRPKEEEVPKRLILSTEVMVPEERVLACLIRGFEWSKEGAEKKEEEAKKEEQKGGGEEEEGEEEEEKMKQVKDIFPEVKAEIIRRLLEEEEGNVERVVQRIIEDCNRIVASSSSSPPKEKEKVIEEEKKEDKEIDQAEQEKKEEKEEGKEVKEEKGKEKVKVGEVEERLKEQPLKRLTELCLEAARTGWANIANHILRLEPQLQDVVVDYMWRNGVFEDVQKTEEEEEQLHHNKQEMIELNDFFEDLLQTGEAGEDSGNDIFCFGGMRDEEEGASGFMMMDEELARTLQNIEEEAMRTLRRMEEEDGRLALRLVAEERQESKRKEDERLAFALAREEVVSTSAKKNVEKGTNKEENMMQLIKRLEQEEEQERKRREKEDEEMAKRLLAEEKKLIKAKLEDEERARKASERKLRELEDERFARQLEERERMHSSSKNSYDKDFAKALQLQQEEEAKQLKEEIERRRKREEELSQQYIEKMLLKQQTEESHYNPPSTITPPITAITTTTNTFTNTMTTTNEDSTIATYTEVEESDWKSCSFFDWDTRTMEQFLRSRGGAVKVRKILKPELVERFEKKWFELIKKYGSGTKEAKPRLACNYLLIFIFHSSSFHVSFVSLTLQTNPQVHGTRSNLIPSIVTKGLLVPGGSSGVGHTTDSGWYGKGIYLSPNPDVSLGYTHGGRMLVCSVLVFYFFTLLASLSLSLSLSLLSMFSHSLSVLLIFFLLFTKTNTIKMGKVYKCTARCDGAGCRPGYDSHESPCGQEYVLFSAAQVLPCYLIEFSGTATNVNVSPSTPFTFHPYQPKNDHKCILQ
ncbi:YtxH domain-containing protein [Balamuthia mandrillaris]